MVALRFAAVAVPFVLALGLASPDARACSAERGIPQGTVEVVNRLAAVPRDAGIVVDISYAMAASQVVEWLAPTATLNGAPLAGTFRVLEGAARASWARGKLLFTPATPLAAGDRVEIEHRAMSYPPSDTEGPKRAKLAFDVTSASLADLDLARGTLTHSGTSLRPEANGATGRCVLASPRYSGDTCGGGGQAMTEVAFPMRAERGNLVTLELPFAWSDEMLGVYTTLDVQAAFSTWPTGAGYRRRIEDMFTPNAGRTCVTVKLGLVGDVAPATTREVCTDVPALAEVTADEHAATRAGYLQSYTCSSVVYPDGEAATQESVAETRAEDGAGGCSASPVRTRGGLAASALVSVLGLVLGARRRRR